MDYAKIVLSNHYDENGEVIRTDAYWQGDRTKEALISDGVMADPNPQCFQRAGNYIWIGFNTESRLNVVVVGHDDERSAWRVQWLYLGGIGTIDGFPIIPDDGALPDLGKFKVKFGEFKDLGKSWLT